MTDTGFRLSRRSGPVLGVAIDRISRADAAESICTWAAHRASRTVFLVNVHMTMEAVDDPSFAAMMRAADLALADGAPVYWTLRSRGYADARHVRGQDIVLEVCSQAEKHGLSVGLFGTTDEVLRVAREQLATRYPRLEVAYAYAPPFRPLTAVEDAALVEAMVRSGAQIIFVSLGCPKQERWIAAHRGAVPAVMIGAGAAIDMLGGLQPVAPRWMQVSGLEWVFRLASDPVRLWRRYARHNARFLIYAALETLRGPAAAWRTWEHSEEDR